MSPISIHVCSPKSTSGSLFLIMQGRNRRKKCDEARPSCTRCLQSRRTCVWPTVDELTDRRHIIRSKSDGKHNIDSNLLVCHDVTRDIHKQTLEATVVHHFSTNLLYALINPESSPPYCQQFREQIEQYMEQDQCLQHAILSISASHLHLVDGSSGMRLCAIQYYSLAIQQMSTAIAKRTHCDPLSSLLTSVIMLYINGVSSTAPQHVHRKLLT